jgi:type III pantothenate kinase
MKVMLIDIGNSRIKWRVVDHGRMPSTNLDDETHRDDDALPLNEVEHIEDQWRELAAAPIVAAYVSNVASAEIARRVVRGLLAMWGEIRVEQIVPKPQQAGVINGYRDAAQLGPDRWLAMIGAHALLPTQSLLICSFGTATTIDLLTVPLDDQNGHATFNGGLILPGIDAMRRSLARETARLPDRGGAFVDFADNTDDAIASGVLTSQLGAVERAIRLARSRQGGGASVSTCLVAGGASASIAPMLDAVGIGVQVIPDLVLRGLQVVACGSSLNYDGRAIDRPAVPQDDRLDLARPK